MFTLTIEMFGRTIATEHETRNLVDRRINAVTVAQNAHTERHEVKDAGTWFVADGPFEGDVMGTYTVTEIAPKVITWHAVRDSSRGNTDEDRAMAHLDIYSGENVTEAVDALMASMLSEADGLVIRYSREASALRRAAYMLDALAQVPGLADTLTAAAEHWGRQSVEADGITWALIRTER